MAHVSQCTGWTWDYILDNIDLPRLDALRKQWKELPPICIMLAGYFGILGKKEDEGDNAKNSSNPFEKKGEDIGELVLNPNMPRDPLAHLYRGDPNIGTSHLTEEERSKLK